MYNAKRTRQLYSSLTHYFNIIYYYKKENLKQNKPWPLNTADIL